MSSQQILDAAFRAYKQSGSQKLFAVWLNEAKNNGTFWSA